VASAAWTAGTVAATRPSAATAPPCECGSGPPNANPAPGLGLNRGVTQNDDLRLASGPELLQVQRYGWRPVQHPYLVLPGCCAGNVDTQKEMSRPSTTRSTGLSCKQCGGRCLCHTGVQLAGIPCPVTCTNWGKRFDGCHLCDCGREARETRVKASRSARQQPPPPPPLSRVKDPTGRVDWLVSALVERYAKTHPNPAVKAAHQELAPALDTLLRRYLGPRTPTGRKLRQYIREGNLILRKQAELRRGAA